MHDNPAILLVEDEIPLSAIIKKRLEDAGIDVVTARDIAQAMDYLENMKTLSAVWLDHYLLGSEDGLVLVAKLKAENSKYKALPIFVVSNTASDDKVQAYMNFGVDKYFVKAEHKLEDIIQDIAQAITNAE